MRDAGVQPVVADAPSFVEATRREEFLFLLNHSDTETATVAVPQPGVDPLTGTEVSGSVPPAPLEVRVIRHQIRRP